MKGARQTRDETIGTMIEGLRTAGKDDILAPGYTFASLIYQPEDDLAQQKAKQLKSANTPNSAIDNLLEMQTMEQARQALEEIGRQSHG